MQYRLEEKEEGIWYFRVESSMIQLEVNLLYQRNGENTSLVVNLTNEGD